MRRVLNGSFLFWVYLKAVLGWGAQMVSHLCLSLFDHLHRGRPAPHLQNGARVGRVKGDSVYEALGPRAAATAFIV